jgi:pimeloyl-ACP methyl ester carboxylesterase
MTATRLSLWFLVFVLASAGTAYAAENATSSLASPAPAIVIGFVGGFVHHNDLRHSEVQLAQRLRTEYRDRVHIEILENRRWRTADQIIRRWLDANQDGALSDPEKRGARVILFGSSWGAAAVISLARRLEQENIPVRLTVQVDSIAKLGQDDRVIPGNVENAINFYQTRGLLHGRSKITAADPAHTEVLGDFRFNHAKAPTQCHAYPWLDRLLFSSHIAMSCDPAIWSQVQALISTYLVSGEQLPYKTAQQ